MNSSTESSVLTDPNAVEFESGASGGGRVRGQRLEITPADLTMFSAIVGRKPSREERDRALHWAENGSRANDDGVIASASASSHAIVPMPSHRFWHPAALSLRVREIWFNGIEIRVNRPQISSWLKKFSTALQQGRRRVRQSR